MKTITPKALSVAFVRVLSEWLTADQLAEINKRNAAEQDASICHTHDFCDANQAMITALDQLGQEFIFADDTNDDAVQVQTDLCNAAWELAKMGEFCESGIEAVQKGIPA